MRNHIVKNRNENNTTSHYRIKISKTMNMVSQQTLKAYEFTTIQEYYEYILLSIINGQRKQAYDLANKLSKEQKRQAIEHLEIYVSNQADECKKIILSTF